MRLGGANGAYRAAIRRFSLSLLEYLNRLRCPSRSAQTWVRDHPSGVNTEMSAVWFELEKL